MRIKLQHAHYTAPDESENVDREGFYFEIQADGNYETLCTSEIYNDRRDALLAIDAFRRAGLNFSLNDLTQQ